MKYESNDSKKDNTAFGITLLGITFMDTLQKDILKNSEAFLKRRQQLKETEDEIKDGNWGDDMSKDHVHYEHSCPVAMEAYPTLTNLLTTCLVQLIVIPYLIGEEDHPPRKCKPVEFTADNRLIFLNTLSKQNNHSQESQTSTLTTSL